MADNLCWLLNGSWEKIKKSLDGTYKYQESIKFFSLFHGNFYQSAQKPLRPPLLSAQSNTTVLFRHWDKKLFWGGGHVHRRSSKLQNMQVSFLDNSQPRREHHSTTFAHTPSWAIQVQSKSMLSVLSLRLSCENRWRRRRRTSCSSSSCSSSCGSTHAGTSMGGVNPVAPSRPT